MTMRYVKNGDAEITLVKAPDDPRENNPVYLKDVAVFSKALHATGVDYSQRGMAFDSVDAQGYLSQLEKGVLYASLKIVDKLAKVLDVEPAELRLPPKRKKPIAR